MKPKGRLTLNGHKHEHKSETVDEERLAQAERHVSGQQQCDKSSSLYQTAKDLEEVCCEESAEMEFSRQDSENPSSYFNGTVGEKCGESFAAATPIP